MQGFTHTDYPFLQELGIGEDNHGCYMNGGFTGSGKQQVSVSPFNNKPIAKVRLAS